MDTPILSHTANSASAHSLRGSPMVGLVWAFPHGLPYCLKNVYATIRFMLFLLVQLNYISVLLHLNFLFYKRNQSRRRCRFQLSREISNL